jgi:two-component system, NarL family, invasion response regulator UvrY
MAAVHHPPSETPRPTPPIRVALVEDHELMRMGLRQLLEAMGGYQVVLEAANGAELVEALEAGAGPELVLVDLLMPVMDGYDTLAWLREHRPGLRAVVLSVLTDDGTVVRTYRAGACALLTKGMGAADLRHALDTVMRVGVYHTANTQRVLLENPDGLTPEERRRERLLAQITPRCLQVLELMGRADDPTYEVIATELGIGRRTVESHVKQLFDLFGVNSKTALVLSAVRLGIVRG